MAPGAQGEVSMQRLVLIGMSWAIVAAAAACKSSDGDEGSNGRRRSLAEALTNGIEFDNGVLRTRPLPASEGAERVRLDPGNETLRLQPDQDSLLSFGLENPDEDGEPVDSILLQFSGSENHIDVPRSDDNVSESGGEGSLTVEIAFHVKDDICEQLCNRRYTSQIIMAVTLDDGSVSVHVRRTLELDCREEGDPDFCGEEDVDEPRIPPVDASMPRDDAAAMEDAATPGPDASADAGTADAGDAVPPPQIGPLTPANVGAGMEVTLAVAGAGFVRGAVVYVDGEEMPTTYLTASSLEAEVSTAATSESGSHAVWVDNVPGDDRTRSNVLYLQVDPPPGAPLIYDYSPDNGVPGDTILIISRSLAGETLMIHDVNGTELTAGALSTISWPTAGAVDTVEVVLPDDIETGPITVSNSIGAYKGKIFSVGQNLTRAAGTLVESSSEYNVSPANWSRASGADNLLATSFFTANYDCASQPTCTMIPWFQVTFASAQAVGRIAMRGNREYASGYDFLRGKFEVLDAAGGVLWEGDYDLPAPDRDLDLTFSTAIAGARSVRFTSIMDESVEPGFAELEVFGP
jgi:hypothetical protein